MQQNLVLNDQVYNQNHTTGKNIIPSYITFNMQDNIQNDEVFETSLEEESTHSLEECQIWIPIKDKVFFESINSHVITEKKV